MIDRFTNHKNGNQALRESLMRQVFVHGCADMVERLATAAELKEWEPGDIIIQEGGHDRDVFMILAGKVAVECRGREVVQRKHHQHVGEMALIESHATRSATIRALETTVTAKISEIDFVAIADEFPQIWRGLAAELSDRVRQWTGRVRSRNEIPRVFIGSAAERIEVINRLTVLFDRDRVELDPWMADVFDPSSFSLIALETAFDRADFAVFVVGDEDVVTSRKKQQSAPRDNVIFELGMAIGALGHDRTFVLKERGIDLKMPSDLLGFTPVDYAYGETSDLAKRLAPAKMKLMDAISERGPR